MKFRVFHKELNKYLEVGEWTDNTRILDMLLSIDLSFVIVVGMPNEKFEIGKDVEIERGFEYEGKEYFENDIVKFKSESKIMEGFKVVFQNDGSFAMTKRIGHKLLFHYFNSLNKRIAVTGNYRLNPELMGGLC